MAVRNHLSPSRAYGSAVLAAIRFVPGASPTIEEQWGIRSLVRNGAGDYTVSLLGKPKGFVALASYVENDTTLYHVVRVDSRSDVTNSVQVTHKSVAFASVATGPALSDTVDAITVVFLERSE